MGSPPGKPRDDAESLSEASVVRTVIVTALRYFSSVLAPYDYARLGDLVGVVVDAVHLLAGRKADLLATWFGAAVDPVLPDVNAVARSPIALGGEGAGPRSAGRAL